MNDNHIILKNFLKKNGELINNLIKIIILNYKKLILIFFTNTKPYFFIHLLFIL